MGQRIPPGLPPPGRVPFAPGTAADHRADRKRHARGSGRHPPRAAHARCPRCRHVIRSAESLFRRPASAGRPRAVRHHPRTGPRGDRRVTHLHTHPAADGAGYARAAADECAGRSVPRRPDREHPQARVAGVSCRSGARDRGNERLRDGDRQTGCPAGAPLGAVAHAGGILSGSRQGRPRWQAIRMSHSVATAGPCMGKHRAGHASLRGGESEPPRPDSRLFRRGVTLTRPLPSLLYRPLPSYSSPMHDALYFSDHHLQVREMVRDFAKNVVKPTARQYDLDSRFPWDNVKQMAELGLFGIPWPEELGGSGMDYLSYIIVIHELAKVDASHAITVSAHTTLGTSPIVDFGTD